MIPPRSISIFIYTYLSITNGRCQETFQKATLNRKTGSRYLHFSGCPESVMLINSNRCTAAIERFCTWIILLNTWIMLRKFTRINHKHCNNCGPGSSVGTATGYRLEGPGDRITVGPRLSAPVQTGPGAHPASCKMGTGSFPEVKSGRGVTLTPHPLLVPWSWKSRAIPLLPLWAVRPVQSLSACTKVHFTFFLL